MDLRGLWPISTANPQILTDFKDKTATPLNSGNTSEASIDEKNASNRRKMIVKWPLVGALLGLFGKGRKNM